MPRRRTCDARRVVRRPILQAVICAALALSAAAAIGHAQASRDASPVVAPAPSPVAPAATVEVAAKSSETALLATSEKTLAAVDGAAIEAAPKPKAPKREPRAWEPPPSWLTNLQPIDLPIDRPERVGRALQWLTGTERGRDFAIAGIRRSGRYAAEISRMLYARKLPRALLAVAMVESGFKPDAVSPAGAAGLWQLMPATAQDAGLVVADHYDERRGFEKATGAALDLLGALHLSTGSWDLALAAYDLGLGRLRKTLARYDADDYWTLVETEGALPDETRAYVPMVLACALLLENLDAFGLEGVERDRPAPAVDLEVPAGTKLAVVARAAATSLVALRALNPEILAGDAVPDEALSLHLPADGLSRARVMLPTLLAGGADFEPWTLSVPADFDWGGDGDPRAARRRKKGVPGAKDRTSPRPWLGPVH